MAKTKTKSGSKVKVTCQICGKVVTKAGMQGHLRWGHKRDPKAPMLRVEHPLTEARRKAALADRLFAFLSNEAEYSPADSLKANAMLAQLAEAYGKPRDFFKVELEGEDDKPKVHWKGERPRLTIRQTKPITGKVTVTPGPGIIPWIK